ncbi:hypothetical protein M0R45_019306 [Rubus argutus]|uniref:Uncharacterized protein n=1 Tax=Rubus argutus TaxID=59490 RepID=A0AAW1X8P7_RUBAR
MLLPPSTPTSCFQLRRQEPRSCPLIPPSLLPAGLPKLPCVAVPISAHVRCPLRRFSQQQPPKPPHITRCLLCPNNTADAGNKPIPEQPNKPARVEYHEGEDEQRKNQEEEKSEFNQWSS